MEVSLMKLKRSTVTGFSIPKELYHWLEMQRGDVSRSRFLQRIIEHAIEEDTARQRQQSEDRITNGGAD
jgi:metal-responsive CopG/Arc/MetJ family transcriptional regulator